MRDKKKTKKYVAVFVLKEQGTFTRLAKRKFKPTDTSIRFRKRTFILDTSLATYSAGLKQFFFIDFVNGQTYLDEEKEQNKLTKKQKEKAKLLKLQNLNVDPEITDMLISRKIISQLTANLTGNAMGMNIMTLIIGVVIGACIGYIVAGM